MNLLISEIQKARESQREKRREMDAAKRETETELSEAEESNEERARLNCSYQFIVAMKGRVCTGKSTLAKELARSIGCASLDYDEVRDSFFPSQSDELLGDLCYKILWQMAFT